MPPTVVLKNTTPQKQKQITQVEAFTFYFWLYSSSFEAYYTFW